MTTPTVTHKDILAAYERHETAAGGIERLTVDEMLGCVRGAAAECGVSYDEARDILREAWAGLRG